MTDPMQTERKEDCLHELVESILGKWWLIFIAFAEALIWRGL